MKFITNLGTKTPKKEGTEAIAAITVFIGAILLNLFGIQIPILDIDPETQTLANAVIAAFTLGIAWVKKLTNVDSGNG